MLFFTNGLVEEQDHYKYQPVSGDIEKRMIVHIADTMPMSGGGHQHEGDADHIHDEDHCTSSRYPFHFLPGPGIVCIHKCGPEAHHTQSQATVYNMNARTTIYPERVYIMYE